MGRQRGRAADHVSLWQGTVGDWSDPANWDTPSAPGTFPINGGATYDAILNNGGSITLDVDVVIEKLDFSSGTILGGFNLTLNDSLTWTGGVMEGTGTTTVAGSGSLITGAALPAWTGRCAIRA